jgi:hypothetical protein
MKPAASRYTVKRFILFILRGSLVEHFVIALLDRLNQALVIYYSAGDMPLKGSLHIPLAERGLAQEKRADLCAN